VHASIISRTSPTCREDFVLKLLSQDPSNYRDAPTEGVRRVLNRVTGVDYPRGAPLPVDKIGAFPLRSPYDRLRTSPT
jgi:5-oxoprolinase (ATP-hydrolysing)